MKLVLESIYRLIEMSNDTITQRTKLKDKGHHHHDTHLHLIKNKNHDTIELTSLVNNNILIEYDMNDLRTTRSTPT